MLPCLSTFCNTSRCGWQCSIVRAMKYDLGHNYHHGDDISINSRPHHAHHAHLPGEMYLTVLAGLACGGGGGGEVSLKAGPNKPPPAPTTPCPTPPCPPPPPPPPPSPCPPPPRPPCPPEAWEVATPPRQRGSDPDRWGLTTTWLLLLYLEFRPHHHDLILSIIKRQKSNCVLSHLILCGSGFVGEAAERREIDSTEEDDN